MSSDHHTPLPFGAALEADVLNAPLGELDAAIGSALGAIDASALAITTTDAVAAAGQPIVPVASTQAFVVGQPVFIGDPDGVFESKVIDSIQAGVSLTMTANLVNTYPAGKIVSSSPAEVVDARGGQASLDARLDLYDAVKSEVEAARDGEASLLARLNRGRGAEGNGPTTSVASGTNTTLGLVVSPARDDGYWDQPNSRLVVPAGFGGWHVVSARAQFATSNLGLRRILHVMVGGVSTLRGDLHSPQAQAVEIEASGPVYLPDGTAVQVQAFQDTGANLNVFLSRLAIARIAG